MTNKVKDQINILYQENQALLQVLFPEYYVEDVQDVVPVVVNDTEEAQYHGFPDPYKTGYITYMYLYGIYN